MLTTVQVLLIGSAIALVYMNEVLNSSSLAALLRQSDNFGTTYRISLLGFYAMSVLTSLAGLFTPLSSSPFTGVSYFSKAYLTMGSFHVITLGINSGLHFAMYCNFDGFLEALDVSRLFTLRGVLYEKYEVVDMVQRQMKCCGVNKPNDWFHANWTNDSSIELYPYKVPKSCCKLKHCAFAAMHFQSLTIHHEGCIKSISKELLYHLKYNFIFPGAMFIGQAFIIALSIMGINMLDKEALENLGRDEETQELLRKYKTRKNLRKLSRKRSRKRLRHYDDDNDIEDDRFRYSRIDDEEKDVDYQKYLEEKRKRRKRKLKKSDLQKSENEDDGVEIKENLDKNQPKKDNEKTKETNKIAETKTNEKQRYKKLEEKDRPLSDLTEAQKKYIDMKTEEILKQLTKHQNYRVVNENFDKGGDDPFLIEKRKRLERQKRIIENLRKRERLEEERIQNLELQ